MKTYKEFYDHYYPIIGLRKWIFSLVNPAAYFGYLMGKLFWKDFEPF